MLVSVWGSTQVIPNPILLSGLKPLVEATATESAAHVGTAKARAAIALAACAVAARYKVQAAIRYFLLEPLILRQRLPALLSPDLAHVAASAGNKQASQTFLSGRGAQDAGKLDEQ